MPVIDKNYRLFGVINLIDLVVVIALVVGGYAVYKVLAPKTTALPGTNTQNVEFTVIAPLVRGWDPSQIRVGDTVALKSDGKPLGTVVSVEASPTVYETYDTTLHKYATFSSAIVSDVTIKVKGKGVPSGTGIAVGNTQLRNNESLAIITPTFEHDTAVVTGLHLQGQ